MSLKLQEKQVCTVVLGRRASKRRRGVLQENKNIKNIVMIIILSKLYHLKVLRSEPPPR